MGTALSNTNSTNSTNSTASKREPIYFVELHLIVDETSERRRRRYTDDFLIREAVFFRQVARKISKRFGLPEDLVEDVQQEVLLIAARLLDPNVLQQVETSGRFFTWRAAVTMQANDVVRMKVDNGEFFGISGQSGIRRRRRALAAYKSNWRREYGSEPTDEELLASYNDDIVRQRSNAVRQGMVASESDLHRQVDVPLATMQVEMSDSHDGHVALLPIEAKAVIERGVERCTEVSDDLARCAVAYYGGDDVGSVSEVAKVLGIGWKRARELMRDVDDVMRAVLEFEFDVARV